MHQPRLLPLLHLRQLSELQELLVLLQKHWKVEHLFQLQSPVIDVFQLPQRLQLQQHLKHFQHCQKENLKMKRRFVELTQLLLTQLRRQHQQPPLLGERLYRLHLSGPQEQLFRPHLHSLTDQLGSTLHRLIFALPGQQQPLQQQLLLLQQLLQPPLFQQVISYFLLDQHFQEVC